MATKAIEITDLSKRYQLGEIGTGTISHDLNRWWARLRGKEDPGSKVGVVNDRTVKSKKFENIWALKDINLSIDRGEVIGIIGRNGAGKSTLLKILSRVTAPTKGLVRIHGRIASLLEVGTGFHPELTGRENIFMNGTIMGMTRKDINRKMEEIVEFAGVEKYIDTPTKRYSSGMNVRLGFAVAAFLESEILIVDEVLAVGDAEFQKRALGKMKNVISDQGRTVLLVSHNMKSISGICSKGIVVDKGTITFQGSTDEAISNYMATYRHDGFVNQELSDGSQPLTVEGVTLKGLLVKPIHNRKDSLIRMSDEILLTCEIEVDDESRNIDVTYQFKDDMDYYLFTVSSENAPSDKNLVSKTKSKSKGLIRISCHVPSFFFNEGQLSVNLLIVENSRTVLHRHVNALRLSIQPISVEAGQWAGKTRGPLKPIFSWEKEIVS